MEEWVPTPNVPLDCKGNAKTQSAVTGARSGDLILFLANFQLEPRPSGDKFDRKYSIEVNSNPACSFELNAEANNIYRNRALRGE